MCLCELFLVGHEKKGRKRKRVKWWELLYVCTDALTNQDATSLTTPHHTENYSSVDTAADITTVDIATYEYV